MKFLNLLYIHRILAVQIHKNLYLQRIHSTETFQCHVKVIFLITKANRKDLYELVILQKFFFWE